MPRVRSIVFAAGLAVLCGCRGAPTASKTAIAPRPSILLVTLDTTRADAIGRARGGNPDALIAIEARGRRFTQAYATVPETLPSHTSMMTGLYPGGHGVHENARYVPADAPLLAERLRGAGYQTSAFVSAYVLDHRFGLARGFDRYDDRFSSGRNERNARETTDAVLAALGQPASGPRFIWVHYYDPHAPYAAPTPHGREGTARQRYQMEVDFMAEQLGRLASAFTSATNGEGAIAIAGDHGEGLGDHGEAEHGHLLFQSTMHVPLVIAGPGVEAGTESATPVSTRRVYHTILDWAGLSAEHSLRKPDDEVVLGEGMKPFLEYGWQSQVMAVAGRLKSILAGKVETYDVIADPGETMNLGSGASVPAGMRKALEDYPVPSPDAARAPANLDPANLDNEAKRRLAALGYVNAGTAPVVRKDAPRPADMTALLATIERASGFFAAGQYRQAIPLLERTLSADPHNLAAVLQLATAYSSLGDEPRALAAFQKAAAIAPGSQDVRTYLALHYARTKDWPRAIPLLEQVVAASADRQTAVEALGALKVREAGQAMDAGDTARAIAAFERARQLAPAGFRSDLDLGVLYLAARRFDDAKAALDRALAAQPDDPMALFKRAQVSVLLREPDAASRIALARRHADERTRPLIERERLFRRE